jgi:hypothetical protein
MVLNMLLYSGENLVVIPYYKSLCRISIISLLMIYYFVNEQSINTWVLTILTLGMWNYTQSQNETTPHWKHRNS